MVNLDECARVAHAAVLEAAQYLRAAVRQPQRVELKGAIDLVTESDRAVESLVTERLRAAFPEHRVIGEEASTGRVAPRPHARQYAWYLDPLDGTTNFAHGHPHFAVSLALARGRELLLGMVADPLRDELFAAVRGRGATLNGAPMRASRVGALGSALLGTGTPYDRRERADLYLAVIKAFMMRAQGIRRGGSAALDLCWVASGRLDGYWEWRLGPWDVAAGALIVREAGGSVSDFSGRELDLHGEETLASNGAIHAEMLAVLAAANEPRRG
ncbi:MAG: inositol monophosphatase [Candidatus Binatia bacterium]